MKRGKKSLLNVQATGETTWGIQAKVSYLNIEGGLIHASEVGDKLHSEKDWKMVAFEPFESG